MKLIDNQWVTCVNFMLNSKKTDEQMPSEGPVACLLCFKKSEKRGFSDSDRYAWNSFINCWIARKGCPGICRDVPCRFKLECSSFIRPSNVYLTGFIPVNGQGRGLRWFACFQRIDAGKRSARADDSVTDSWEEDFVGKNKAHGCLRAVVHSIELDFGNLEISFTPLTGAIFQGAQWLVIWHCCWR